MLSSTTNIKHCIEYLQWIQNNLDRVQGLPDDCATAHEPVDLPVGYFEFHQCNGLCDNILNDALEYTDIVDMFLAWPECASKVYPCGDHEDFVNDRNLYRNPKRLDLIEHCIKYMQDVLEKRYTQED